MTSQTIKCILPPAYLGRNVIVTVEKVGSRWQAFGIDPVSDIAYPLEFNGYTGSPRFATKGACLMFLNNEGDLGDGDKLWALPQGMA